MPGETYFVQLIRILYLFIEFFVDPFVDISLTFSDTSFTEFSINTCFGLFELTFLFGFISLSSKSVFLQHKQYYFCLLNLLVLILLQNYELYKTELPPTPTHSQLLPSTPTHFHSFLTYSHSFSEHSHSLLLMFSPLLLILSPPPPIGSLSHPFPVTSKYSHLIQSITYHSNPYLIHVFFTCLCALRTCVLLCPHVSHVRVPM